MEFMRKAKGSISIFLCIILMPMVTYSTMIIDASRLQVSRTNIATAGDLAMNAALSEYEKVLQDMYGLFAVSQYDGDTAKQQEMVDVVEMYFQESLLGKLTEPNATEKQRVQNISNQIAAAMQSSVKGYNSAERTQDLNNLLVMAPENFQFSPIDGSTLANQAIMKRQIIEYMKYKGPVSLASNLLPKLEMLRDSSKQTKVVKKKVAYTKKLKTLQDACENAWWEIEGFKNDAGLPQNGYRQALNMYTDHYSDLDQRREDIRTNYRLMSQALLMHNHPEITFDKNKMTEWSWNGLICDEVTYPEIPTDTPESRKQYLDGLIAEFNKFFDLYDLYTTDPPLNQYITIQGDTSYGTWLSKNQFSVKPDYAMFGGYHEFELGVGTYDNTWNYHNKWLYGTTFTATIDCGSYLGHLDEIKRINAELTDPNQLPAKGDIEALKSYYEKQKKYYEDIKNPNNYWIDLYRAIKLYPQMRDLHKHYKTAMEGVFTDYFKDLIYANNEKKSAVEDDDEANATYWQGEMDKLNTEYGIYLYYYKMMEAVCYPSGGSFEEYANEIQALLENVTKKDIYIDHAKYYAAQAHDKLSTYRGVVNRLYGDTNDVVVALDDVIAKIGETETAKGDWQGAINNLDQGATKSSMQSDLNTTTEGIKKEDVDELKGVFQGIYDQLGTHLQDLKKFKFMDVVVVDYVEGTHFSTFQNHDAYKKLDNLSISNRATNIAKDVSDGYYEPAKDVKVLTIVEINGVPEDQKFYNTLKSICEASKPEMTEEESDQLEAINNSNGSGNTAPEAEEPTLAPTDPTADYSDIDLETIYKEISAASGVTGGMANFGSGDKPGSVSVDKDEMEDMDDDDMDDKADESEDTLDSGEGFLEVISELAMTAADYAFMEEYFTEMFTCRTDATTSKKLVLLNGYNIHAPSSAGLKTVNTNTPWFGKEIEYILWGDAGDIEKNWRNTDGMIYAIRLALNAVYAFTSPQIHAFATQIATAIAGWTVIGVPIVAAIVTIALAAAESAYDLVMLHQGRDVPIYKSATTFVCSPTGLKEGVTELVSVATEKAQEAVDTKIDEFADSITLTAQQKVDKAKAYVNGFVNEQADAIHDSVAEMIIMPLSNSIMPIAMEIDNASAALDDTLKAKIKEAVNTAFAAVKASIDDLPEDSAVALIAKKVYFENEDAFKDEIYNKIVSSFDVENVSAVAKLNSLRADLIDDPSVDTTAADYQPQGVISKKIYGCRDEITKVVNEKTQELQDSVKNLTAESADKIKTVLHDGIDKASQGLSGSLSKAFSKDSLNADKAKLSKTKDTSVANNFTLNYKEYCKIFILISLAAGNQDVMLNRAATIIEANVRTAVDDTMRSENFRIVNAYTLVSVQSDVKMQTLFPWAVAVQDSTGVNGNVNVSLDFKNMGDNFVTIQYQAVNGY